MLNFKFLILIIFVIIKIPPLQQKFKLFTTNVTSGQQAAALNEEKLTEILKAKFQASILLNFN